MAICRLIPFLALAPFILLVDSGVQVERQSIPASIQIHPDKINGEIPWPPTRPVFHMPKGHSEEKEAANGKPWPSYRVWALRSQELRVVTSDTVRMPVLIPVYHE